MTPMHEAANIIADRLDQIPERIELALERFLTEPNVISPALEGPNIVQLLRQVVQGFDLVSESIEKLTDETIALRRHFEKQR